MLLPARVGGFSRLLTRIDSLPGHGWWTFPLLFVGFVAWLLGILWASGILPVGTFSLQLLASCFYAPYMLAAIAYINRSAERALDAFWPATGWPEGDRAAWRRQFVTSPPGFVLPAFALALVV